MVEPINSTLYLINNIELDNLYEHTIDFETPAQQKQYFDSKVVDKIPTEDYSYIRQNENIKIFSPIDNLIGVNYLYYDNGGKRHFCFINDKIYINDETTELVIQEDVMQTYMFDYDLDECFIEREHVDRYDDMREPIYDEMKEDLDYGEDYDVETQSVPIVKLDDGTQVFFLYVLCNKHIMPEEPADSSPIFIDQGTSTGYYTYCLPFADKKILKYQDPDGVVHDLIHMAIFNQMQAIQDIFFHNDLVQQMFISPIPPVRVDINGQTIRFYGGKNFLRHGYEDLGGAASGIICLYERFKLHGYYQWPTGFVSDRYPKLSDTINVADKYQGLEPKTFVYPYHLQKVIYGQNELTVKPQLRTSTGTSLTVFQSLSDEATALVNISGSYKDSLDVNGMYVLTNQMPAFLNLTTNQWQKYMLEHKAQREAGFNTAKVSAGISIVSGLASGSPLGWLSAGSAIASNKAHVDEMLAKEEDIKNLPDDIKQFNGDLSQLMATDNINIIVRTFDARQRYKDRLAKYFHYYGYKVNDLRVPNIKSRYNFNYIKNIDTNIKCKPNMQINHDILNQIKDIYNKGITFWHYHQSFKGIREYDNNNYEVKFLKGETL